MKLSLIAFLGAAGAILALVLTVYGLIRHVRADGVKEGRAIEVAAQAQSNAKAQVAVSAATADAVEQHAAAVVYIERQAQEATYEIDDASDLDGALGAWAIGIDSLRPQAAAQPDHR